MAAVETLEDWNKLLACCCEMPSCPVPIMECQSRSGDATVAGYAPFIDPGGSSDDLLPTIYRNSEAFSEVRYYGTGWSYESGPGTYPLSGEYKNTATYNGSLGPPDTESSQENSHDEVLNSCLSQSFGVIIGSFVGAADESEVGYTSTDPENIATATECGSADVYISVNGTEPTLAGCPGPFGASGPSYAWNYTKKDASGTRLLDPKTPDELIDDAVADAPATWPTGVASGPCPSAVVLDWPLIGDYRTWPACGDGPQDASGDAAVTLSRFRLRVPVSHEGTWFRASWDLVFFPAGGGTPTVVAVDQTDTWTGPGTGDQDDPSWLFPGGWHEIPLPTEEGETRVVNFRFECYRGPYGNLPQTTGEGYASP